MKSDGMANGASSAGAAEQAPSSGSPLLEAVSFHALESRNDGALWDCSPGCVIMYDSNVAFVRQLEVMPSPFHNTSQMPSRRALSPSTPL